jgi:CubicO group peptidase (beta-lactamase class C family)
MKFLLSLALVLSTLFAFAQKKVAPKNENRLQGIEEELDKVLKDWKGAGFAVAVVEKDKVIYAKGFGVKNLESKEPINENTLFAIGSCTKAFTATLVGMLAEEGKLSYDEPVRTYLPALQFYNNDMNNLITLRDMMSHKTGLPRHDLSWYLNQSENRDSLIQRIKYQEPTFKPKEKYQYNNFMFLAQGVIIEKLTGTSWENNMREKLFKPLGMTRSNMPYEAVKNDPNLASPYQYKNDSTLKMVPHYNIGGMGPAGAVYSSVAEMSKWIRTWIHGGKYNGKQIIPASHFTEAISAQVPTGSGIPDSEHPDISGGNYGFGWFLSNYRGHYRVEHGGAIDGFIASTCFYPTDSIGIIVLSNQDSRTIPSIVRNLISDRMLELKKVDWNKELLASAAKTKIQKEEAKSKVSFSRKEKAPASHSIGEYEGIYNHPGYGKMDVYAKNDSLFVHTAKTEMWLRQWHYDIFYPYFLTAGEKVDTSEKGEIAFRFNTNTSGDIESLNAYGMEAPTLQLEFKKTLKPKPLTKAELELYTGDYDLAGQATVKVYIKEDSKLFIEVPGQPPYELIPTGNNKFSFKVLSGYFVEFDKKEGALPTALTFMQPNGNFKANRKK